MTTVVVHADAPAVDICGRTSTEWLLDAVAGIPGSGGGPTIVVRSSAPLVRPATLAAALAAAVASGAPVAVLAPTDLPWWSADDQPVSPTPIAVAAPGPADASLLDAGFAASVPARPVEGLRVDDPAGLAAARSAVYRRIAAGWQARGVVVEDPATTRIDARVTLAAGVRIAPYVELSGATSIGAGTRLGPSVTVRDSVIGADGEIRHAICQGVRVGDRANIGPYAWLRSGTVLGDDCRVGTFVELADSTIGDHTSIPHLGGLFSADVGRRCNIAGMSGPANFNGVTKNRVVIGDDVSVGAGSILVAPVTLADGASTGAGSTITKDVGDGELALSRAPQQNIRGWREALLARQRAHAPD